MGFPNVIGCMDDTHIRTDSPKNDPDSYRNRKKYFSIQKRLRDVFIGYPGSVHDARVFRNSPLSNSLAAKCGDRFILADSAYPCRRHVLTPYRDNGNLTEVEKYYNTKLSHSRIYIEHTFGILKQKFRQLYHLKLRDIHSICHFIRACCVLHNLSLEADQSDAALENDRMKFLDNNNLGQSDDEVERDVVGNNFRNYIAAIFNVSGPITGPPPRPCGLLWLTATYTSPSNSSLLKKSIILLGEHLSRSSGIS
ncbi:hypothetical protein NQ315_014596 [Exocentrus adspersus]|uniref:DDE Tnp4 domain-containing protein n=1 Tax=Exocentrus adspersus TaxID=1586481 RepID=A0AAV8VQZ6_9CUCU|nr:hypothetical protein NQ315_014596 [Exocentrus adspersus]